MNPVETISDSLPAGDLEQLAERAAASAPDQPITIYEVHLPSWMRVPEEENRSLTFFEIAPKLAEHAKRLSFTHVQLHTRGFIDPIGLRFVVDSLHQHDLGVVFDDLQSFENGTAGLDSIPLDGYVHEGKTHLFGYDYHWDNTWAEEIAAYLATDPLYRKFRQGQFRRRDGYAFDTNFILPLSERLVTPPRQSLFALMPGDAWQKLANLRLLFAYTYLLPGKKLVFMGNEFGQQNSWRRETSLDWHLLNGPGFHTQLMNWVASLNRFYREEAALYETDSNALGFQWVDTSDAASSVISFLRQSPDTGEVLLTVLNFTPVPRHNYRVGVPRDGFWRETLNSDALEYGGSGQGNLGGQEAAPFGWNFQSHSLMLTLPPLGAIVLKAEP
jgi:1,4-alpha-glucan branching enzyme